jgi:hypothetical protein
LDKPFDSYVNILIPDLDQKCPAVEKHDNLVAGLFDSLKKQLRKDIPIIEMDKNINDVEFADECAKRLLAMLEQPIIQPEETHG